MIVGVPKEIKDNENRVALTPAGAMELTKRGHTVYVEANAGKGSGFPDGEYTSAGAEIIPTAKEVFDKAEIIVKVKEPLDPEIPMLNEKKILFTYLHLASDVEMTKKLIKSKVIGIAYETVEKNRLLPLLAPMSEVAGRMAPIIGSYYLQKPKGGYGMLLSGAPGTEPARVVIVGGGFVGANAARIAYGMGADVTILDVDEAKIRDLNNRFPYAKVLMSNEYNLRNALKGAHLLVGAVLIPGAAAPKVVKKGMLKFMVEGAVAVDVAIDQGGVLETSHPTKHSDPVFVVDGVTHYCVTNMPGAYPRTSTIALTNATLPYLLKLADKGLEALKADAGFMKGLNLYKGKITFKAVSDLFSMEYTEPESAIG
ncbi:alanine dehydrogenase [Candidatus Micrarchaeota archaeon CG_4_10_14_0_2_um_filter_49_7]|nr:MAG: alanine dehydrogenase [Candidatus Micrarchaeota archaeon CG1_02_49_24]PIZ95669.1 MAG: alanine dehydrogenase [Candidatus Micrarchaeota archaeon CG_4_10_14_0_2_um_filter_49_7]HII53833.1 alanine dehydrogenase [Candidatus Micrarchaeota archaeon]